MAGNDDIRPADPFAWVKQKAAEAAARLEQKSAETPRQLWLPGFDIGAMPNHINRSSLFAPVARGRRKFHRQTAMVTRSDCVLEYTGEQLDEADADLVMALIFFAQKQPLGTPVPLHRAQLLRKIGRSTGKHDYEWLHRRIKALTEATLFLEARKPDGSTRYTIGKTVSFRIVSGFVYDDETESYTYTLDLRWVQMFSNREYALIDWDKRLQIGRGQDMAKALQRLFATSSDQTQRYALDWLKDKLEYSSPMRKFRESLMAACAELERLEIIARARIEQSTRGKEQLAVWLPASG
jgi:hypothetical protein